VGSYRKQQQKGGGIKFFCFIAVLCGSRQKTFSVSLRQTGSLCIPSWLIQLTGCLTLGWGESLKETLGAGEARDKDRWNFDEAPGRGSFVEKEEGCVQVILG
jgi:hypothetical protein